jgi:molybdate transport system permease protein
MRETAAEGREASEATEAGTRSDRRAGGGASHTARPHSSGLVLLAASMPLVLFVLLPLLALVLHITPADFLTALADPAVGQALQLSLVTTLISTGLALLFGTPAAYLLARRRFPGRTAVETLLELPMILPPAVAGIALLVAFGRRGLLGQWLSVAGIDLAFTTVAVVLAQLFVAGPFYVKAAIAAFTAVEREVEQAAAVDGAGPLAIFRHVTLPLAAVPLIGGTVMMWARALGEFGATIIFAGNFPGRTQTMPLAIYLGFELNLNVSLALALILLGASAVVLLLVKGILGRSLSGGIQ